MHHPCKAIHHRDSIRVYWVHSVWTVNILVFIVVIWWGMFWWSNHENWYAYQYLFITLYAIALFFLAAMLYPWDMSADIDVREYFYKNRLWFFGTLFLAWCIDIPETLVKANEDMRPVPEEYFVFVTLELAMAATGLLTKKHVVHLLLPVLWFCCTVFYVLASAVGQIAG